MCYAQSLSHVRFFATPWTEATRLLSVHEDSPGKNPGVGCHAFLQRIFPTQRLNPGLLHCRRILYCLNHQGSPRILLGSLSLLQGIFLTQQSNQDLPHWRWILYQLSFQRSPKQYSFKKIVKFEYFPNGTPKNILFYMLYFY